MEYGLIGEHLPHSFSKIIHDKIGRYAYELHEVAKDDLDDFMTKHDFKGINVTIPYKQAVIPYLTVIDPNAEAIGAVNTIVNREGQLYGYNTDFGGMEALIRKMDLDPEGKKILILGTGGTSKTAFHVAQDLGAAEVYKCSRHPSGNEISYEEAAEKHADAEIIINTTPCGMYPNPEGQAIDLTPFKRLEGVVDAVYNPLSSQLVLQARSLGAKAEGGLYMLVAQAVIAAEIYLGESLPENLIDRIYREVLDTKLNIILTGMPASGKSAMGKRIAAKYGFSLTDTDAMIVQKAGMEITQIFAEYGEKYFRDLESEVIRDVSMKNGQVISTGGGAVLRPENVRALKMNGPVIYLNRSLSFLRPTDDRPLADDLDKMKNLYEYRLPIYEAAADYTITCDGSKNETFSMICDVLDFIL